MEQCIHPPWPPITKRDPSGWMSIEKRGLPKKTVNIQFIKSLNRLEESKNACSTQGIYLINKPLHVNHSSMRNVSESDLCSYIWSN